MNLIILFVVFFVMAVVVVFLSMKLAKHADIIESNSTISGPLMGLILAGATSLPEMVSGLTSMLYGDPVMATSNVLGSNVFNITALMILNLIFIRFMIFRKAKKSTIKILKIALVMYVIFLISYLLKGLVIIPFMNFEWTTLIIFGLYLFGVYISKGKKKKNKKKVKRDEVAMAKSPKIFVILIIAIVILSMELAHVAESIVTQSSLSQAAAGAVFIGIATSLPNVIACLGLIKLKRYKIAISSIVGSLTFNFLSFSIFDFISITPIYKSLNISCLIVGIVGLLMSLTIWLQAKDKTRNRFLYAIPSVISIGIYLAYVAYLFIY